MLLGSHGDHRSNAATACPDVEDHDATCSHDNVATIVEQVVQFVRPFVSRIRHGSLDHMIRSTPLQDGCVSL